MRSNSGDCLPRKCYCLLICWSFRTFEAVATIWHRTSARYDASISERLGRWQRPSVAPAVVRGVDVAAFIVSHEEVEDDFALPKRSTTRGNKMKPTRSSERLLGWMEVKTSNFLAFEGAAMLGRKLRIDVP
jgi:hypothetical protein